MRVTNKMLSNNFLADMKVNLENINKIQQQNTSGKKFRKPSDDPFGVARSMQLHTDISTNKQYSKNITDVSNWLDTTDTALDQAGNVLHRVRELLISAGNGGYSEAEKRAIKDEINEKIGEMSQILNTSFGGNYIFGGTRSTTKPMEVKGNYDGSKAATTDKIDVSTLTTNGKLKSPIEITIKFKDSKGGDISKSIKLLGSTGSTGGTEIKDLSDLANKLNQEIKKDADLQNKIKVVPNMTENTLMFVNTDKTGSKITVSATGTGTTGITMKPTDAEYQENSSNVELVYNKKEGGELTGGNEYNQIASKLKIEVSQGVTMDYNVSATDVLEFTNEKGENINVMDMFTRITSHLDGKTVKGDDNNKSIDELLNKDLQDVTDTINNLLKIRSEVGAKQNRIEGADDRNKDGTFNMTKILSKHEDVDYTTNMTDYATMLTVYMASLQTSAKIIQPSLMDYLR